MWALGKGTPNLVSISSDTMRMGNFAMPPCYKILFTRITVCVNVYERHTVEFKKPSSLAHILSPCSETMRCSSCKRRVWNGRRTPRGAWWRDARIRPPTYAFGSGAQAASARGRPLPSTLYSLPSTLYPRRR